MTRMILLTASLALNVFLAGWLVGQMAGSDENTRPLNNPPEAVDGFPLREFRSLPPDQREEMREYVSARLPELRTLRREMRTAQQSLFDSPDPGSLDAEAIEAELKAYHELRSRQQEIILEVMAEAIGALPPEERAEALLRVQEGMRRGPGRLRRPTAEE